MRLVPKRQILSIFLAVIILLSGGTQAFAACVSPAGVAGILMYNADYKVMQYCDGTNWIGMGSSLFVNGNKGDITVGSGGSSMTVNNSAITYAKIQDVSATNRLLGRASAGAGAVEEITIGSGLTLTGATLSASGSASAAGALGYVQISDGSGNLTYSGTTSGQQFIWDNTNKRLGIGTDTPTQKLDIVGTATANEIVFKSVTGAAAPVGSSGSTASSGAAGYVQLSDGAGAFSTSGSSAGQPLFWDNTNKRLGIGTATPNSSLHIAQPNAIFNVIGTTAAQMTLSVSSDSNNAPTLQLAKTGGSSGLVTNGHMLGDIQFFSANSSWSWVKTANITVTADGAQSNTSLPTRITFTTTSASSTTPAERFRIDASGASTFTGNVTAPAFLYSSDLRLKENVKPIDNAPNRLASIKGVTFTYKQDSEKREHLGVIAQDVEAVFPQAVITDDKGFKKVDYPALIGPMIEAIKDLKAENEALRKRLDALEHDVTAEN